MGKKFKVILTANGVCDQHPSKTGYFRIDPDQPWYIVGGGAGTETGLGVAPAETLRVLPNPVREVATVEVPLRIRGEAIGLKDGGQLRQLLQKVTVTCPAYRIPKNITARVGSLKIGKSVKVKDLECPDSVTIETDGDTVVIEMYDPKKIAEE